FEQGQLDGLKPEIAVVMIGTNNSNNNKDGTEQFTTAEILEGVDLIVKQLRERLPGTKIILNGIFPRGKNFNAQRGKLLQVNQALEKLADGKNIFYIDFGSQLIEADGSISPSMMRDALHPGERGYEIWAAAIEPKVKELLAK
ncbi:MAG: GDSL-type esterase/lipase family protein, partial [Verrucomicrobiota bacterium]